MTPHFKPEALYATYLLCVATCFGSVAVLAAHQLFDAAIVVLSLPCFITAGVFIQIWRKA
jgi:hypothetical protein